MIETLLFFMLFVVTWIHGFHAVTRPDKLLSFLGAYIKEEGEFDRLKKDLDEDLVVYLHQFMDDVEIRAMHENGKFAEGFVAACRSRMSCNKEYARLQAIIDQKINSKKWKFILAIAPMWSECKVCMSSWWTVFFALVFGLIMFLGLSFGLLIAFAPINIAGITSIFIMFSNEKELNKVSQALNRIADEQ